MLLFALGEGGLLVVAAGVLGLVVWAAGVWWFLAYRGAVRVFGLLVAVAAPVAVLVLFAHHRLWLTALVIVLCWGAALVLARAALRRADPEPPMRAVAAPGPQRPVLFMNPRSGGGKVGRFGLVERAEEHGARVVLLDHSARTDVAALARTAVAEGADLLGVAGGDGSLAPVAAVAAEHDLPFLVVPAGTRNHFALDLGLDRADPSRTLAALTGGEELRVDLGEVSGRAFVNTVSFGVYADIVQSPGYREDKVGTVLALLPELLAGEGVQRVDARADATVLTDRQALLVSNNPYGSTEGLGLGDRRPQLDGGELGVLGIRVDGVAEAADVVLRGTRSTGLRALTAQRVEVTAAGGEGGGAGAGELPVAVDGDALRMPVPVVCTLHPRALRVLVPRDRPGLPAPVPTVNWRRLAALAFGRADRGSDRTSREQSRD
ncbi:diacylglycerol/lipid kinase family protein [Streptomyces sp. CBMA156]|uniref:diacylglycerol/lipid kinase family protein n=1 Tax=Streptomyces sp. CBMA156 TaxID=1930280 RepID=UPI0016620523|nr:diacylglycerol kinase family protein [Streptomyces sp. CBMA156]